MSDLIFWGSVIIALIYVPRYLWKVYGGPPILPLIVRGVAFLITSSGEKEQPKKADIEGVYIPVSHTAIPAIKVPETDGELLEILADYRKPDNKFRFSANQIYTLMGGDRNTVMRQIREFREGKSEAQFRTDPERDQWRAEMGLPSR